MPSITFDKFDVGLDRRKGASVSDANRLRELQNAYVTNGRAIRKRPGLALVAELETGTRGLVSGKGKLNTFFKYGAGVSHTDARFLAHALVHSTGPAAGYPTYAITRIDYAEIFSGYFYVAVTYADGNTFHYYLDTETDINLITDADCPHSKSCIKLAEKMFAIDPDNDIVKYSDTGDPKVWTPAAAPVDAGFLPTGLRSRGSSVPTALGQYQSQMAVFMSDSMQLWTVDPAGANMALDKTIEGIGTTAHESVRQFAGDIVFKAKPGFRSITQQAYTNNLNEVDIGSAIDQVVKDHVLDSGPMAEYSPGLGQLWQIFTAAASSTAFVYTFSREMKISAWSEYSFGFPIEAIASLDGDTYLRSGDSVYVLDEDVHADDGDAFEMRVELPFLDFKSPGILKAIHGFDAIIDGTVQVRFRFDPNDETKITDPITITGNGHPLSMIPMEMCVTAIAPVFTSTTDEPVQIDSITFYYDNLGPF